MSRSHGSRTQRTRSVPDHRRLRVGTLVVGTLFSMLWFVAPPALASLEVNQVAEVTPADAAALLLSGAGPGVTLVTGSVGFFGSTGELRRFDAVDLGKTPEGADVTLAEGIRITSAGGDEGPSRVHTLLDAALTASNFFGESTTGLQALKFDVSVAADVSSITMALVFHSTESCGENWDVWDVAAVFVDETNYAFLTYTNGSGERVIRVDPNAGLFQNNTPPQAFSNYACRSGTLNVTGVFDKSGKTPDANGRTTHEVILAVSDTGDNEFPSAILVASAVGGTATSGGIVSTLPPSVTTSAVTDLTTTSVTIGGNVTADGGAAVIARGLVYGPTANPVLLGSGVTDLADTDFGNGIGAFSRSVTGLEPGVTYHVRAYAESENGLAYGASVSFTTLRLTQTLTFDLSAFPAQTFSPTGGSVTLGDAGAIASSGLAATYTSTTPAVCTTTSSGVITTVASGTCTIRAVQSGSALYAPSGNVDQSFTILRAAQTLTFATPDDAAFGDAPIDLSGRVSTTASGLTPTLTTTTTDVCTASGTTVTVVAAGVCTLTAGQAGDTRYLAADSVTRDLTITRKVLTVTGTFTVADKVYDGTATATLVTDGLTLVGVVGSDEVALAPVVAFVSRDAASEASVVLTSASALTGTAAGDYELGLTGAPSATATITRRPVTVGGASAVGRPIDGSTAVSVAGAAIVGGVAGDALSLAAATTGVAASAAAGTHAVTTAMVLAGADAPNYLLTAQPVLSVTFTPLPIGVTVVGEPTKVYDGTTALPVSAGQLAVSGLLPGQTLQVSGTGTLAARNAGTQTLTVSGLTFTPGPGTTLADYVLPTSATGIARITPRPVTITGAQVTSRPWDGTTVAEIAGARLDGAIAGDAVTIDRATTGTFASALPGTHPVTTTMALSGASAGNYRLTGQPVVSGTIVRAAASLRITGGLLQFVDGTPKAIRATVLPADSGTVVITYDGGSTPPSRAGRHAVLVTLVSPTHEATALRAELVIEAVEVLLELFGIDPASLPTRPDGTTVLPVIGPILEDDGTTPALPPGFGRVLVDGEPVVVRVEIVEDRAVRLEGDGFDLRMEAATPDGEQLPVDGDGTLLLDRGGNVDVAGSGFAPGTVAEVWMFPTATFLGTALVGPDGTFSGTFPVADALEPGEHTIQLNGTGVTGEVRSASLGVKVAPDGPRETVRIVTATGDGAQGVGLGALTRAAMAAVALLVVVVFGLAWRSARSGRKDTARV
jgi:hypothetical protein